MARGVCLVVACFISAIVSSAQAAQTPKAGRLDKRVASVTYQEDEMPRGAAGGASPDIHYPSAEPPNNMTSICRNLCIVASLRTK